MNITKEKVVKTYDETIDALVSELVALGYLVTESKSAYLVLEKGRNRYKLPTFPMFNISVEADVGSSRAYARLKPPLRRWGRSIFSKAYWDMFNGSVDMPEVDKKR